MGVIDPVFEVEPRPVQSGPVNEVVPGPVPSYLPLVLPSPTFDGPLLAVPKIAVGGRTPTVDWGDGVISEAVFTPDVDGWLAVRVNRVLDENATYNVNVLLMATDNPKDWLEIPLLVLTPSAPATDGPAIWNATGYSPPVPVEVGPSELLWVSLPVFEPAELGPAPTDGSAFTPSPPGPPLPPAEPAGPGPIITLDPPPNGGPVLPPAPPIDPPATPAAPFTSPPGGVMGPINPPVVHPASYSPFEAGPTRAALASTPPAPSRTPPPPDPRADTRPTRSRADEKPTAEPSPIASSTPADEPETWDWVIALGVGPLELAAAPAAGRTARSGQSEERSDRGAKDHDRPPPTARENSRGTSNPRDTAPPDTGSDGLLIPPPEADRLLNPSNAPIARQPGHASADGSPEAILAALAAAPTPDAIFADSPAAAESPEDRQERWGWRSGAMALAAAVWAGVWFLWPRLGHWVRSVDPATVVPDGPTPTRVEVARPVAPRSAELAVEPVVQS